jgi:hypothetical protein
MMNARTHCFRLATFLLGAVFASGAGAQTIYRCPDANGRVAMQDTPCTGTGGAQVTIKPASGGDGARPIANSDAKTTEAAKPALTRGDSLKRSVARMEWERKDRENGFAVRDAENVKANLQNGMSAAIAAIASEFRTGGSQLSNDVWLQKQQSRMINVRLDYQGRIQAQDDAIRTLTEQQAKHRKNEQPSP